VKYRCRLRPTVASVRVAGHSAPAAAHRGAEPGYPVRLAVVEVQVDHDDYEDRLPLETLRAEVSEVRWDHIQDSGIEGSSAAVRKLGELWDRHLGHILFR
jgi:hypothetical protein